MFGRSRKITINLNINLGEKFMLNLEEILNKISAISIGVGTDPQVKEDIATLKTQIGEALQGIADNKLGDEALATEVANVTTALDKLVDKLGESTPPVV